MPSKYACHRWLGFFLSFAFHSTRVHSFQNAAILRTAGIRLHSSSSNGGDNDDDSGKQNETPSIDNDDASISPMSVKIDDGESDLNDRFKYKVHALMGTYDPAPGVVDDDKQTGNIIGAMLEFPTEYTFTAVGKTAIDNNQQLETESGDYDSAADVYASDVKKAFVSVLGSDAKVEMRVIPRGKKFTRVSAKVTVDSASVISSIYEELDALEATVMKF